MSTLGCVGEQDLESRLATLAREVQCAGLGSGRALATEPQSARVASDGEGLTSRARASQNHVLGTHAVCAHSVCCVRLLLCDAHA